MRRDPRKGKEAENERERERATRSRRSVFVAATEEEIKGERTTIGRYSSSDREAFAKVPHRASSTPGISRHSPPAAPSLIFFIHRHFTASAAISPYCYPSVRRLLNSTRDWRDVVVGFIRSIIFPKDRTVISISFCFLSPFL